MAEKKKKTLKKLLTALTLVLLGLIIFFSRHEIAETLSNLDRINVFALSLIIVLILIKTHAYGMIYRESFSILGIKIPYRPMFRMSLELNFVNNVFPSAGVSGFSYFGLRMKQFGVTPGKATLVHTLRFVAVFVSFQILLFLGLFILALDGKANNLTILVASSLATLLLVGTILIVYIIGSRKRIDSFFTGLTKLLNKAIHLIRPKYPETINIAAARVMFLDFHDSYMILRKKSSKLKGPLYYATIANVSELMTIYCIYLAFNSVVNPGAIIIAYVIANFAGLISVLPGGVGVYEGLMTAVLATAGVPPAVSLPATIMYRVLTSAIQLPPGYYFYHRALYDYKETVKP